MFCSPFHVHMFGSGFFFGYCLSFFIHRVQFGRLLLCVCVCVGHYRATLRYTHKRCVDVIVYAMHESSSDNGSTMTHPIITSYNGHFLFSMHFGCLFCVFVVVLFFFIFVIDAFYFLVVYICLLERKPHDDDKHRGCVNDQCSQRPKFSRIINILLRI